MKLKLFILIFSIGLLFSNCGGPELTPSQKFEKVQVGMPLQEVLDIFGLKDTIGKSTAFQFAMVKMDTLNPEAEPKETGEVMEVVFVAFDSSYSIQLAGDSVVQKIDNTNANQLSNGLDTLEAK